MPGGNVGPGAIVEISSAFANVEEPDVERRTIRVGAGAVADRVQERARARGLRLPALPASSAWCTVGGMVANNSAGPRSFAYGSIRPRVAALEGVDGRGRRFRVEAADHREGAAPSPWALGDLGLPSPPPLEGWPRVRKNSSGYALDHFAPERDPLHLLVGGEGTLALITHAELRLEPVPEARGLVVSGVADVGDLVAVAGAAGEAGAATCEFLGPRLLEMCRLDRDPEVGPLASGAYALVLLEVEGREDEVEERLGAVVRALPRGRRAPLRTRDVGAMERLWTLRHRASPTIAREADRGRISTQFMEDSVVPPGALGAYLEGVDEVLGEAGFDAVVFGHAGDGNVHVNPLVDVADSDWRSRVQLALERTVALVSALGGTLAGEHGDGRLRAPLLARIWPETYVMSFERVKRAFDPEGILNPGVILPLPGQEPLEALRPRPRAFP